VAWFLGGGKCHQDEIKPVDVNTLSPVAIDARLCESDNAKKRITSERLNAKGNFRATPDEAHVCESSGSTTEQGSPTLPLCCTGNLDILILTTGSACLGRIG